jgi:hypothetical protein
MMRPLLVLIALLSAVAAFSPSPLKTPSSTVLKMANDEDLLRWARSSRSAGINDRVVELKRPLGLVLQEDDDGNVYVETVAPRGNAGRTGMVRFVYSTVAWVGTQIPQSCTCASFIVTIVPKRKCDMVTRSLDTTHMTILNGVVSLCIYVPLFTTQLFSALLTC